MTLVINLDVNANDIIGDIAVTFKSGSYTQAALYPKFIKLLNIVKEFVVSLGLNVTELRTYR